MQLKCSIGRLGTLSFFPTCMKSCVRGNIATPKACIHMYHIYLYMHMYLGGRGGVWRHPSPGIFDFSSYM